MVKGLLLLAFTIFTLISCIVELQYKRMIHKDNHRWNVEIGTIRTLEIVFDTIETIRIIIFERLFVYLLKRLLRWENYKYSKDLEDDFVRIISLFQLFNKSAVILIIYWNILSSKMELINLGEDKTELMSSNPDCINSDCYLELYAFCFTFSNLQLVWSMIYNLVYRRLRL